MKKTLSIILTLLLTVTVFPFPAFSKEYSVITLGTYPQSIVTDDELISILNEDTSAWISYNYCHGVDFMPAHSDYMKYKDVEYNGNKYRGVIFSDIRPLYSTESFPSSHPNGYNKNIIYWFSYEPVDWLVLDEETGLVISSLVLDAQSFADDAAFYILDQVGYFSDSTCSYAANNYEVSTVRSFLNDGFYNISFTDEEKDLIVSSELDLSDSVVNSAESSNNDKLFVLSKNDIENSSYFEAVTDYCVKGTDYALCQGLTVNASGISADCLTRTAVSDNNIKVAKSNADFTAKDCNYISGIRPAMYLSDSVSSCHHEYEITSQTEATCTSTGSITYSCKYCEDTYTVITEKKNHTEKAVVGFASTCTQTGLTDGIICSACGAEILKQTVIPLKNHNLVYIDPVEPTCHSLGYTYGLKCSDCGFYDTEPHEIQMTAHEFGSYNYNDDAKCLSNGTETAKCKNCDATDTREFPNTYLGHTGGVANCVEAAVCTRCGEAYGNINPDCHKETVDDLEIPATCTSTGLTSGSHCAYCKKVIVEQEKIQVKNHDYEAEIIAPTCVEKGYTEYSCKYCSSKYKTDYVNELGHSGGTANCVELAVCTECGVSYGELDSENHKNVIIDEEIPSSCTKSGLSEGAHCVSCGKITIEQKELPKAEHICLSTVVSPNCTEKGYTFYYCKNCDYSYLDSFVNELGHTGGTANCVTRAVCTRCGEFYGDVNPENHKSIVSDAGIMPTCILTGLTEGEHCIACGAVTRAPGIIPVSEHQFKTVTVSPTCTAEGSVKSICKICGFVSKNDTIPATGHTDSNSDGICDNCGSDARTDAQKNCGHICHKEGIAGFIWRIINAFNKLFRIKQYCDCGLKHW